ncbi:MAG: Re/Si-specific NAD(P)(+) transhydrogenase subunit alpha [Thermomicrobiales bacterium]|nr:Re/Si-specific NAD(P)(+) transhydrogenase subunit alpha [Thermomicrobiales bacterium]MCA9880195.1 Re/Si-specific NAD(P)(+) transhydrogenase subunit alpha [Thermomicrobiales bacterium]
MEGQSGGALTVGVPKETAPGERRVALIPDTVKRLTGAGVKVKVQRHAGVASGHSDDAYVAAGAGIVDDAQQAYGADLVIKVQKPTPDEAAMLRSGATLIALLQPMTNPDLVGDLAARNITSFSMDAIPRTTRAQSMDVLSSQATVAGYKAVLMAADNLPKFFPMLTTAAGSIIPAKVLVVGAGVAGLQAIATARRLGAVVEAYDTRPVVKEQVESLGAKFVDIPVDTSDTQTAGGYAKEVSAETLRKQQEVLADHAAKSDVVITTAAVPGRAAPRLISKETVERMRPGSVIVDLAAETGGNVEVTKAGETVHHHGVAVMGQLNLPSTMPVHASQMYAKNIQNLLELLIKQGAFAPDYNDEIVKGTVITRNGEVVHEMTKQRLAEAGKASSPPPASTPPPAAAAPPVVDVVSETIEVAETNAGAVVIDEITAEEIAVGSEDAEAGDQGSRMGLRVNASESGSVPGDGTHNCPPGYPVKANAQSQIYHLPESSSYHQTIPEFCFATAEGAEAAGFRASRT